ncbi:MAG: transketolase [Candidatus Doudnabacteria bacterium]|nr:transketolase [Candidatus Doudnabacteria bacterium]
MIKLTLEELKYKANDIRKDIIEMLLEAKSGHSAGPLDMADVFAALYFYVMNHDPKNPQWAERDRFVLSAGHIAPVLYATLAEAGYFPKEELKTLRKLGTRLHGHPHRGALPGIETSSGPLAQGTSQAIGMALALRMDHSRSRVFCVTGDGELNEGQCWEAFMFAGKNKLHNLTFIVDRNNIQIDGYTEDVMPLEPLRDKFEAFNFHVIEVDGHNVRAIIDACNEAKAVFEKPTVIIAHTIAGKGVDFMEGRFEWHGIPPGAQDVSGAPDKKEQGRIAIEEIRTLRGQIKGEHE